MLKKSLKSLLSIFGYELRKVQPPKEFRNTIADSDLYRPLFSPWLSRDFQRYFSLAVPQTLVSADRCYVLYALLLQALKAEGDIWECGVYRGGTAAMMAEVLKERNSAKKLFLFDTFEGMPETDAEKDRHQKGDFSDTSLERVKAFVGHHESCVFRPGFIPQTFSGLEGSRVALAHIDVDIYKSILDSLDFIWPRLSSGGFVVFDDYGFPSCPGARAAVDEFFLAKESVPLCLPTGQAIVFKGNA